MGLEGRGGGAVLNHDNRLLHSHFASPRLLTVCVRSVPARGTQAHQVRLFSATRLRPSPRQEDEVRRRWSGEERRGEEKISKLFPRRAPAITVLCHRFATEILTLFGRPSLLLRAPATPPQ